MNKQAMRLQQDSNFDTVRLLQTENILENVSLRITRRHYKICMAGCL
jgi:hypothetical protein